MVQAILSYVKMYAIISFELKGFNRLTYLFVAIYRRMKYELIT